MKKKLLHLLPNSPFSNYVTKHFEELNSGNNAYVYIYLIKGKTIAIDRDPLIEKIALFSFRFIKLLSEVANFEAIAIHYLDTIKALIAFYAKKKTKLTWFMWGSDFYDNIPELHLLTVSKNTRTLIRQGSLQKWITRYSLFPFVSKIFNPVRASMKLMDFCAPVCFEDFLLAKQYLNQNTKYIPFSYAIIEAKDGMFEMRETHNNILIGNSASPSNNHIEILELLSQKQLDINKIIIPLSYGNMKYGKQLIHCFPPNLKDKIIPITTFLPKDEYFNLINTCSIAIFNYYRQEGLGNLIELFASGCKVFINRDTALWNYFKRLGLIVFSIEDQANTENNELSLPLSYSTAKLNYEIITKEYDKEHVESKIRLCINTIYE